MKDFSSSPSTSSGEIVIKQQKILSISNTMGRVFFSSESQEEAASLQI